MVYIPPSPGDGDYVDAEAPLIIDEEDSYSGDAWSPNPGTQLESRFPVFSTAEELLLGILRPAFEPMGIKVADVHTKNSPLPIIIVRSTRAAGATADIPKDVRFLRAYRVMVTAIMDGEDADRRCAHLLEAVQHVIMNAWYDNLVIPGAGHIARFSPWSDPVRVSDFQTATNIVQYASLPRGAVRYEQNFALLVRPDSNPYEGNEFIKSIQEGH